MASTHPPADDGVAPSLPRRQQARVDTLLAELPSGEPLDDHPAFVRLTAWFERDAYPAQWIASQSEGSDTPLFYAARWDSFDYDFDDDTADFAPDEEVTDAMRLAYMRGVLEAKLGGASYDGEGSAGLFCSLPIRARDGRTGVLGYALHGGGPGEPEVTWYGVFASAGAFRDWLRGEGYVTGAEDLDALGAAALRYWAE